MPRKRGGQPSEAGVADSMRSALLAAGDRAAASTQSAKKNYAERLSRELAVLVAHALRPSFPGILPDRSGVGQESKARSAKGFKKLDVNYSTPELGLGLGVSIKTINFRDKATARYTKNYTRADAELRAEASDYHDRQPYAVMIAVVFLPIDSCDDGSGNWPSSLGQAVQVFRFRAGREKPTDPSMLFERAFIGLYDIDDDRLGEVGFFDVVDAPPKRGRPRKLLSLSEMIDVIVKTYDARNKPTFTWADAPPEPVSLPAPDDEDEPEAQ